MSFQINRYFDAALETAAAPPVNIAEIMAKHGVKTETGTPETIPDIKIEAPQATVPSEPPKVETTAPAPTEQQPAPSPAPAAPAPVPTKVPEPDWREALKKVPDTTEVLKAIGFDDKMVGFFNKWKSGESIQQYLEAITVDYSKMDATEVMKRQLMAKYPDWPAEDMEELYRMKVTEQYKLDPDLFSAEEVKRGKILLQADAKEVRDSMTAKQQEYIMSKPVERPNTQADEDRAAEEAEQKALTAYKTHIETDPLTKSLMASKILTIGEGEDSFNYEVPKPEEYLEVLTDSAKWKASLFDEKGNPILRKHFLLAAIAKDDVNFLKLLGDHYRKVGEKKAVMPIENVTPPIGTPSNGDTLPSSPAAALARGGVIT